MKSYKLHIIIFTVFVFTSCVSAGKFARLETNYKLRIQDSVKLERRIDSLRANNNELTIRNIKLQQDTLRLYKKHSILMEQHEICLDENREEISRLNSQLYGNKPKKNSTNSYTPSKTANALQQVNLSIKRLGLNIEQLFSKQAKDTYSISKNGLELHLLIDESIIFKSVVYGDSKSYDKSNFSESGKKLISQLANIFVEKDNFDIVIKEYIYVNSPTLKYIPPLRDRDERVEIAPKHKDLQADKNHNDMVVKFESLAQIDSLGYRETYMALADKQRQLDTLNNKITEQIEKLQQIISLRDRQEEALKTIYGTLDRSSLIMKTLMKSCYKDLGKCSITREVSYVKTDPDNKTNHYANNSKVHIVLKLRIDELNNLVNKTN